jgi:hypothetical protein
LLDLHFFCPPSPFISVEMRLDAREPVAFLQLLRDRQVD